MSEKKESELQKQMRRYREATGKDLSNEDINVWNSGVYKQAKEFIDAKIGEAIKIPVQPTDLEKKQQETARQLEQEYQSQASIEKQKEKEEARHRESAAQEQKEIEAYKAQFYGETPEHTTWRKRLYVVTQQGFRTNTPTLQQERATLLQQYINTHFVFGTRTFTPVLMYQSLDKETRIFSEDNGHSWTVQELQQGQWVRGSKRLIVENGKPTRLAQYIENSGLYDLLKTGVYADFILNLKNEEDKPIPIKEKKK